MPSKTARSWQGSPRRRAFVASCCLCCSGTGCRRAPGIRNLGAALLSGTARKRCVLARRRSLSHSVGNALDTLGPQLSRRGAECHREGIGMPPGSAWLSPRATAPRRATRHARARPQTYPFVPHCLYLERCLEAAPRHRACCVRVPPSGSPFPPEPYAHRRHTPQPHARWEAIRLNLNGSGAPSDLRREHPEPRGITVTGTAGDLHPDSPKRAGKPRIRASPHHHLGH